MTEKEYLVEIWGGGRVRETLGGKRIRNVSMNVNSDDEIVCVILFHLISPISF